MHKYQTTMFKNLLFALAGATSAYIITAVNKHAVDYTSELLGLKKASVTKYKTSKKKGLHKTIGKKLSAHNSAPSLAAASKAKGKKLSAHKAAPSPTAVRKVKAKELIAHKPAPGPAAASKAKGTELSADKAAPSPTAVRKVKAKEPAKPKKASKRITKVAEGVVSSPQKLVEERQVSEENIEGCVSNIERHYKILTFVKPQKDEDVVGATKGEAEVIFVLRKEGRLLSLFDIRDCAIGNTIVLDKHVIPNQSCTWIIQMDVAVVADAKVICLDVMSLLASADNKTSHGYVVQGEMVDIVKKCVEKVRQMHADNRK